MPKQYFFEAGTFPELSYTELLTVLESFGFSKDVVTRFGSSIFLVKDEKIDDTFVKNIFDRLGGSVRVGEIVEDIDNFYTTTNQEGIDSQEGSKKVIFGISILGNSHKDDSRFLKKLANSIKKGLKEYGISSRFVLPQGRGSSLNAAQVIRNQILQKGFELNILRQGSEEIYGRTIKIQDLEGFVRRDMNKPETDTEMGTLPPKLARMMVNFTAQNSGTLWDPFCGSGTIPMEAAMLGFNFLASDINPQAVNDTDANVRWLSSEGYISDTLYETFRFDITKPDMEIVKKLKHTDITSIVCEPYMGPPLTRIISEQKANELLEGVKKLYFKLFDLIDNKMEKRGIKVVIIIPSYKTDRGWKTFGIRELIGKRWIVKNSEYSKEDLKWSRKNSIITRNIYILERS
jgi:tRNA G10  N-methylase Trm11